MRASILLVLMLVLAVGCKSEDRSCSFSVGGCDSPHAEYCGVQAACGKDAYKLDCTPPAAGAKQIACRCVENGVVGKTVELEYPLNGEAGPVMRSACGWKL